MLAEDFGTRPAYFKVVGRSSEGWPASSRRPYDSAPGGEENHPSATYRQVGNICEGGSNHVEENGISDSMHAGLHAGLRVHHRSPRSEHHESGDSSETDAELQPGTYRVEVEKNQDSAEVRFFQGGDLVATAPATLTKEAAKCKQYGSPF